MLCPFFEETQAVPACAERFVALVETGSPPWRNQALNVTGGAQGVGRAATEAFVQSFIAILAIDFVLGLFANGLYQLIWPDMPGNAIGGEPT